MSTNPVSPDSIIRTNQYQPSGFGQGYQQERDFQSPSMIEVGFKEHPHRHMDVQQSVEFDFDRQ